MTDLDLHSRLEEVGRKIEETTARIKREDHLFHDHNLTATELTERYKLLKGRLNREIAEEEVKGHHVGALEQSVREWINSTLA